MRLTSEGRYRFTWKEYVRNILLWVTVCCGIGWLFYDWIWFGAIGMLFYYPFYKISFQFRLNQYKKQLRQDFKDTMLSIYSSLSAGAALEESVKRSLKDMEHSLIPNARMTQELALVCQKMERNVPIHQCLDEMALRCDSSDMENFSQVLAIGKRQGGNMIQLVRDSVEKIQRRIEITYEIEGIIGAKRNEFLIMCVIPIGIIVYMRVFSKEFMAVLYDNAIGRICMTVCLMVYIAAILLGLYILKLE